MKEQTEFAEQYAKTSDWQYVRGKLLLDLANPQNGETVLDLGCGTGQLTFELARRVASTGKVIGIDPDLERLKVAQSSVPTDINNIIFFEAKAEQLNEIDNQSIDLIYSNYVIHWIPDKDPMLQEVIRCLRPNGRFVIELVGELMPFLHYVTSLTGETGKELINKFYCFTQDEWIKYFEQNGLIVEHTDWPKLDFEFNSLNDFFDWWEGTTHGVFQRTMLSDKSMQKLQKQYPEKVFFEGNAFQGIVQKK